MQRRRPAPQTQTQTQDLARRFLQLDTGIRLAAAAGGMLPPFVQVDRPESPEQQYQWDAHLHHPKPKPANGPIKIRHIETTAAKTKPVRSVSDPGDAHRLIARFVRTNEEKSRSSTVSAIDPPTPPSPSIFGSSRLAGPSGSGLNQQQQRAFPFPSMRRQTTLENFIELESSANETGREDPLALKMGQILARKAADATRAVSRRRSRSGSISSELRSRMRGGVGTRPSSGLSVGFSAGSGAAGEGSGASSSGRVGAVARPRPPPIDVSGSAGVAQGHSKRESVVVDDRSPHDGNSWARAAAGMNTGTSTVFEHATTTNTNVNAETQTDEEETRGRTMSFAAAASRDSLNSFVFPAAAPAPIRQLYAQPNTRVNVQVPGSPTQFFVPGTPTFAMPGSPASFIMTAPESPMSWVMPATPARLVVPSTPTSFVVVPSPTSYVMQTSPTSGVYLSPVESVSGMGMIPGAYQISPTAVFQPSPPRQQAVSDGHYTISPTRQHPISPTRQHPISPTRQYPSTPTRRQPASASFNVSPTRHTSDAHMNLLRGLSPLPSHGLPLPAPSRPRSFNMLTSSSLAQGSAAPNRFSVAGRMESSVARAPSPIGRGSPVVRLGSPGLGRVGSPLARVASISPPRASSLTPVPQSVPSAEAPAPPGISASPLRYAIATPPPAPAPSALPAQPSSPSPLPTRVVTPSFPIADPSQILEVFPTREMSPIPSRGLSPLPPRLRHHTNASHPSDGSGSDEVVFRGSSSSAASTPSRRSGRRRVRHHMRSNSEGLARRTMSEGVRSKRTSEVRRTSQALMRRAQTGAGVGDAGDMSSDGRELVVFMPGARPPPVPAVPASLSPAPATQYSTPAPMVMVEPPAGPAPPPLVRRESIPLPEAFPTAAPTNPGPPPPISLDVPIQNGTEPLQNPTIAPSVELVQNPTVEPTADPSHKPSIELLRPILEAPAPRRPLAHMPWSPLARVLSRPEMTSREGSFHTAPDSFVEDTNVDTDAEFPSSVPGSYPDQSYMDDAERARFIREANGEARYVSTPAHMDLSDLGEGGSSSHSVFTSAGEELRDVPERAKITSAMRARVATPTIISRKPSGELMPMPGALSPAPSPPRSTTSARRGRPTEGVLSGVFQPGFLIPPSLAPSPLASSGSGSSQARHSVRTPHSHAHTASIPMRHDRSYSPPRSGLPRSVTPRTEASFRQPEEDSFHSTHTADPTLRLPLDDWLEFAMSSMAAMGIPLTRSTLEDLHESEDESVAVAEALRRSSLRRYETDEDDAEMLDAVSQPDEGSEDSLSRSLSDVGSTPSPARSMSGRSMFDNQEQGVGMTTISSVPPEDPSVAMARPTIQTDLPWSPTHNPRNLSSISGVSEVSESDGAMESLQSIAAVVRELNSRTPIPSTTSSQAPRLPSASGSATRFTPPTGPPFVGGPPSYVGSAPLPGIYGNSSPTRALSPGSLSITFGESSPSLSPAPPMVVPHGDRDRFANNLLMAGHRQLQFPQRHSFPYLRDDEYRALDDGEDVVLFRPEEWEQIDGRRTRLDSHATTESAVPVDFDGFDFDNNDPQSQNKYRQFVLSFANALRPQGTNRPPRWVEVALRTLRGQSHGARPRYPSSLFDAIDRVEAGLEVLPPPPLVPGHLSSTFITSSSSSASTSLGSALPEDDQIVEDFVRRTLTPQATPPPQPATPLRIQVDDTKAIPWPVQISPVMPRLRFSRPTSRQTGHTLSITPSTSSGSGYSSLIPPPPRIRPRSIEPRWLGAYAARQWPIPDTYVSRRTFSSPSALSPPMPYHWRPICHISPQRLWEITNLTIRLDMPPPPPPPAEPSLIESAPSMDHVRPPFTTPTTVYDGATPYSTHSLSTHHSRRSHSPIFIPIPAIYPSAGQMMSHPNLAIDQSPSQPSLPLQNTLSRTSIPLVQRPVDPSFSPRPSVDDTRPAPAPAPVASRAMTPAAASRRRTMKDLVGRFVGKERARTRSITHGRSATPLVGKSRFGFAGRVVDVARRVLRHPRRRTRVSSIRSQRTIRDAT
ncbi:hypothetical protein BDV93DRAFT_603193 [Ceratobasidium sp. AG-I]|nr:hypothetical protein BDV93DRAFT_603193 [Ceratobasidium sp. AG-I]